MTDELTLFKVSSLDSQWHEQYRNLESVHLVLYLVPRCAILTF